MSHHHHPKAFGPLVRVLVLSASFMVAEILGGLWSASLALLADSGHMAIDTAAIGLGLFAIWVASKPPNAVRTYGYYRAEILAATLNGALLGGVALWIFFEAWNRLQHPHPVQGGWMTVIAAGGLVVNLVGLKLIHAHGDGSLNLKAVSLHLLFDALGSLGAVIAGILVWTLEWTWADAAVSFLIGALIFRGAFKLLSECVDILLESVPAGVDTNAIERDLRGVPSVAEVHDLHVWALASGVVALSAHLKVKSGADHGRVLRESNQLLHERYEILHATLQLEPESFSHEETHLPCLKSGQTK